MRKTFIEFVEKNKPHFEEIHEADFKNEERYYLCILGRLREITSAGCVVHKVSENDDPNYVGKYSMKRAFGTKIELQNILQQSGMNQSEFSRRFDIPLRTVQDWVAGRRTPPSYVIKMAAEILFG